MNRFLMISALVMLLSESLVLAQDDAPKKVCDPRDFPLENYRHQYDRKPVDLVGKDVDGKETKLSDHSKGKITVVVFWSDY